MSFLKIPSRGHFRGYFRAIFNAIELRPWRRVAVEGGLHEDDDLGPRRDGAVVRRDAQPELVPHVEVVPQGLLERDRAAQLSPANGVSVKFAGSPRSVLINFV